MQEFSAGVIIFHRNNEKTEYLLLKHQDGHWDFAKGHIEQGESERQTADREAREETGLLDLAFISGFEEKIEYSYEFEDEAREKTVVFFLAEAKGKEVAISSEHTEHKWLGYKDALDIAEFDNQKDLLIKANNYLNKI
jgi:bis(5'-nucleosidyl)-tetraphosphatase